MHEAVIEAVVEEAAEAHEVLRDRELGSLTNTRRKIPERTIRRATLAPRRRRSGKARHRLRKLHPLPHQLLHQSKRHELLALPPQPQPQSHKPPRHPLPRPHPLQRAKHPNPLKHPPLQRAHGLAYCML